VIRIQEVYQDSQITVYEALTRRHMSSFEKTV